jgi:hypothetical protein
MAARGTVDAPFKKKQHTPANRNGHFSTTTTMDDKPRRERRLPAWLLDSDVAMTESGDADAPRAAPDAGEGLDDDDMVRRFPRSRGKAHRSLSGFF